MTFTGVSNYRAAPIASLSYVMNNLSRLQWRSRQSKGLSPMRSWSVGSILTIRSHVQRVCQRSTESRGFLRALRFPRTRKVDRVGQDKHQLLSVISQLFCFVYLSVCLNSIDFCLDKGPPQ